MSSSLKKTWLAGFIGLGREVSLHVNRSLVGNCCDRGESWLVAGDWQVKQHKSKTFDSDTSVAVQTYLPWFGNMRYHVVICHFHLVFNLRLCYFKKVRYFILRA